MRKTNEKLSGLRESIELTKLLKGMPKAKFKLNRTYEADCESFKLGKNYISLSTDSVGEEIDLGLYKNPWLWGWMTVMNSVSDLAASGSDPIGILLCNQWKYYTPPAYKKHFFKGVRNALKACHVPLLGGDSGNGGSHCHTSTIIGSSISKPLDRLGIKPGDVICLLGKNQTGNGPAIALKVLFKSPFPFAEKHFKPRPDLAQMQKLKPFVRASIDTSDGIATSLHILRELNQVGFKLVWNAKSLSPESLEFCLKARLHPALLWMSDLGDLQILVAIPEKNLSKVLKLAPELLPLARATPYRYGVSFQYGKKKIEMPLSKITGCSRNISSIRKMMKEWDQIFKKNFAF
jgi:thiamine-monophosphate kinase